MQADAGLAATPAWRAQFGLGGMENPLFEGMYQRASTAVGGSILAGQLAARGGVVVTPDHDQASFRVRLLCVTGLVATQVTVPARQITTAWLDDVAKAVGGQPSSWV